MFATTRLSRRYAGASSDVVRASSSDVPSARPSPSIHCVRGYDRTTEGDSASTARQRSTHVGARTSSAEAHLKNGVLHSSKTRLKFQAAPWFVSDLSSTTRGSAAAYSRTISGVRSVEALSETTRTK